MTKWKEKKLHVLLHIIHKLIINDVTILYSFIKSVYHIIKTRRWDASKLNDQNFHLKKTMSLINALNN